MKRIQLMSGKTVCESSCAFNFMYEKANISERVLMNFFKLDEDEFNEWISREPLQLLYNKAVSAPRKLFSQY
jgi:hypothetical protein